MRGVFVLAAAGVLLCPVLGTSGEFKPVKSVDELDWVVGTWKGKGPLMEETELGPPGTVTNATMNWHKRYDGKVLVNEPLHEANGKEFRPALVVATIDPKTKCVVGWSFSKMGAGYGRAESDGQSIRWVIDAAAGPLGPYTGVLVYERVDEDTFNLRFDELKMGGLALPLSPPPVRFTRQKN